MTPHARWSVDTLAGFRLLDGGSPCLRVPAHQGGRHRLVVQEIAELRDIVASFDRAPGVVVLPANGGLLGAASIAENFALAFASATDPRSRLADEWEDKLLLALRLTGIPEHRLSRLGRAQPMHLSRPERLQLGLARYLVNPPELLVIDHVFSALTRREALAFLSVESLYHACHPFRPVLFVDLDSHGLPQIEDCRQVVRLEEETCPC